MSKFNKTRLRKEIAADQRRQNRAKLAELRSAIAEAKARRRALAKSAVERCRVERKIVREKLKRKRAAVLAELRAERERERTAARQRCALRKRRCKFDVSMTLDKAGNAYKSEKAFLAEMRRNEKSAKKRQRELKHASSAERRGESDDQVRDNLPSDLVPVFDRVRRSIRGTPRMSRTEAFLKWAEENPSEVVAVEAARAEREVAALVRQHEIESRASRRRTSAAVPF